MKVALVAVFDRPYYSGHYLHRALEQLGVQHVNVDYRNMPLQSIPKILADCDFMLVTKGEILSSEIVKSFDGRKAMWYFDFDEITPVWLRSLGPLYDVVYTVCKGLIPEYERYGINTRFLPEAFDPYVNYPMNPQDIPENLQKLFSSDIAFVGSDKERPLEVLQYVANFCRQNHLSLKIWGADTVGGWVRSNLHHYWTGYRTDDSELNVIVATTPILLGFSTEKKRECEQCFSARVYQTLGSKGFLLEEYSKGIESSFQATELATWSTTDNLLSQIQHYLNDANQRENIVENGYVKVINRDTFAHRIKTILNQD